MEADAKLADETEKKKKLDAEAEAAKHADETEKKNMVITDGDEWTASMPESAYKISPMGPLAHANMQVNSRSQMDMGESEDLEGDDDGADGESDDDEEADGEDVDDTGDEPEEDENEGDSEN